MCARLKTVSYSILLLHCNSRSSYSTVNTLLKRHMWRPSSSDLPTIQADVRHNLPLLQHQLLTTLTTNQCSHRTISPNKFTMPTSGTDLSSSFSCSRLNSSTFVIREDDAYGEHPFIYAKIHPQVPIIVLSDTGCDEPSEKHKYGMDVLRLSFAALP